MIKFFDLNRHDKKLKMKILRSIKKIINKKNFINGNEVLEFEKKFASYIKSKDAIACSNGTDALTLALKSLNLRKNSEVIIPAMTYVSTAFSVINAGLKPVLVDIDYNTGLMNLDLIKKKINKNTKVILPVHLYGSVVNINKLNKIKKNQKIIEDASQAHGALYDYNLKKVGSCSDLACFSLYPGKNLGAYGDAGIIVTSNNFLTKKIKSLSNLGASRENKYEHGIIGYNNRLDTLQAAILNIKIDHLDKNNNLRRQIAKRYKVGINNSKINILRYTNNAVYHQFIILTKNRNEFMEFMNLKKIQTSIHYPNAIHQHKALKHLFKNAKLPMATNFARECVSIPIDPYLKSTEINYIIKAINSY